MRKFVLLAISLTVAFAEQKPAAKPKPAPSQPAVTIPADAELVAPRVWRAKDVNGKAWIYRQTPMGISRLPEDTEAPRQQAAHSAPAKVVATEQGDSVRFEQATAMGKRVWSVKKSELSAQEKALFEESKKSSQEREK